jgi:hypothetical protein
LLLCSHGSDRFCVQQPLPALLQFVMARLTSPLRQQSKKLLFLGAFALWKSLLVTALGGETSLFPCFVWLSPLCVLHRTFHQDPSIAHTERAAMQARNDPSTMTTGEVFTIEPIVVAAPSYDLFQLDDKWTVGIKAGSRCAMFEHAVMVSENGCSVLTAGEQQQEDQQR